MKRVFLLMTFFLAASLRLYELNWDQGYHLHPDERWITMVTEKISLPSTLEEFLNPQSPLNPKFFAYGSLPIYLLKFAGHVLEVLDSNFAHYQALNLLGRFISSFFDLGTLLLLFGIGRKIWQASVGLLAAFFYAIAVFPIQNAHFYTVDTQLTFWMILTLYLLINLSDQARFSTKALIGVFGGAALATKISGLFLIFPISVSLILLTTKLPRDFPHRLIFFILHFVFIALIALLTFVILQPYTLIDFSRFKSDLLLQSQMTKDATVFPYTIQYVGTIPYLYQLKNLIGWGLGIPLGISSITGVLVMTLSCLKRLSDRGSRNKSGMTYGHPRSSNESPSELIPESSKRKAELRLGILKQNSDGDPSQAVQDNTPKVSSQLILLSFFWIYFLVIGASAVKFMRYLLPLYPILTLAAAFLVAPPIPQPVGLKKKSNGFPWAALRGVLIGAPLLWTLAFLSIYSRPHTRVTATNWINQNIPAGATLAIEHWDDQLPLSGGEKYRFEILELYEPDSPAKLEKLTQELKEADYIIISSNRLSASIPRWPERYPQTIQYYQKLFNGALGFAKIAEFSSYPQFSIFNFQFPIRDEAADESFTVYDHPKVIIFKKRENIPTEHLLKANLR